MTQLRELVEATEEPGLSVHGMFARATDAVAPTPPRGIAPEARAAADRLLEQAGWDAVRPDAVDRDNLAATLEEIGTWVPGLDPTRAAGFYLSLNPWKGLA